MNKGNLMLPNPTTVIPQPSTPNIQPTSLTGNEVQQTIIEKVKFIELGSRFNEAIRGKELRLGTGDINGIGTAILAGQNVMTGITENVLGLTNAQANTNITGGWGQSRFMVIIIAKKISGLGGATYSVLQGFTDHNQIVIPSVGGHGVTFDMTANVHLNRISEFVQGRDGQLLPKQSFNVLTQRWETNAADTLYTMRIQDMHGMLNVADVSGISVANSINAISALDSRSEYNSNINTSSSMNNGLDFIENMVTSTMKGIDHDLSYSSGQHEIASQVSSDKTIGTIGLIRDFQLDTDSVAERALRTNPKTLPLSFIDKRSNGGLYNVAEVLFDDKSRDFKIVETVAGMTQAYTTGNEIEVKGNSEIAEIAGNVAHEMNIETLVFMVAETPVPQPDGSMFIINRESIVADYLLPGIAHNVKNARTRFAVDKIAKEVHRIYGGYGYNVSIAVLGGMYIEMRTSLGTEHGVATSHNYFANSLYDSTITTSGVLLGGLNSLLNLGVELNKVIGYGKEQQVLTETNDALLGLGNTGIQQNNLVPNSAIPTPQTGGIPSPSSLLI